MPRQQSEYSINKFGKDAPIPFVVPELGWCNGTALRKATRRVSQLYDTILAPCGLRSTQRSILVHIARAGAPTMGDLANSLVLDRSALGHNLKPLERDGLVSVLPGDDDRRNRVITLTELGKEKLMESTRLWAQAQHRFEVAFGNDAARDLRRTLERVVSDEFFEAFTQAGSNGAAQA